VKLLLDTHALIWWDSDPARLPQLVLDELVNKDNDIYFSVVNLWEIQIKQQLRKLDFTHSLSDFFKQQSANGLVPLSVEPEHVIGLTHLEAEGDDPIHKDPFDRLLVAQALAEGMVLVTCDDQIQRYAVPNLWGTLRQARR
jgi:PIN domain nuclease of toxin-antitoxin system